MFPDIYLLEPGFFYEAGKECGKTGPPPNNASYDIGEEMWAFIAHDNLPHLAWLACNGTSGDPTACGSADYTHVDYCDQRPKATDVRIFANDAKHPGGWGTILIVGMRFGGGAMDLDLDGNGTEGEEPGEKFRSAYAAMEERYNFATRMSGTILLKETPNEQ